ncbi:MAG: hypothetical protein ACE5I1_15375, partial [bacterium]
MKKYPHKFAMMIISLFFVTSVFAGEKFYWEPVTEADWSVVADSAKGYRDAVMLFEKVTADDRKFADGKTYLTIYRRIRILDAEGRDWGDVLAPLFYKKQKIEEVKGRTILPDGREIALAKDQIFEKQAIKTKGAKIKQTNFSLPG